MRHRSSAFWRSPGANRSGQTVDFLHDVTVADIELAAREGFASIEHMKRYTAVGMAVDQGRTSNVNALAILGNAPAGRWPKWESPPFGRRFIR